MGVHDMRHSGLLLILSSGVVHSATLTVEADGSGDFSSIQAALDEASPPHDDEPLGLPLLFSTRRGGDEFRAKAGSTETVRFRAAASGGMMAAVSREAHETAHNKKAPPGASAGVLCAPCVWTHVIIGHVNFG